MPQYTFICDDCQAQFDIVCYMSDYDATIKSLKCQKCNSKNVYRDYKSDKISGGIVKQTLGSLAEKNSDKMSAEQKAKLNYEHNKYKFEEGNELPAGMTRLKRNVQNKYLPVKETSTKKKRKLRKKRRK